MKLTLSEATAIYTQEADTWDIGEFQELKLQSLDSGGGKYLVIETKRWAMDADQIQEFANFLSAWMSAHSDD